MYLFTEYIEGIGERADLPDADEHYKNEKAKYRKIEMISEIVIFVENKGVNGGKHHIKQHRQENEPFYIVGPSVIIIDFGPFRIADIFPFHHSELVQHGQ